MTKARKPQFGQLAGETRVRSEDPFFDLVGNNTPVSFIRDPLELKPLVELLPGYGDLDGIDGVDGEDVLLPEVTCSSA